ncbi:hypothetical protein KUTeg_008841 [Tegillarca granosa]|uniref:Ectopic P granules protein 5 homolog n=1 Tax=Tegillarca granosa TaxID=220873 RepID=A0ABQ9FF39_TEGGR|nr:hypothetical protein KUTeg_008841 [Tegillarca granosa]
MAEAVRERRSKTKVGKEEKHPKRKTKEKDKLHVISDDGDVHENEPNVLSECQESQDNREGGLDQTIQPNINISKDDECKVENTELDTGQSSNITTEQDPSSNDILPSANQFLNKQPKTSKISSENTITETKGEQDLSSKDDLDISSHSSQQDLHNPVNSDSSELKSKTQEETDVSESFHSAFSSVGEISDTSPARGELKAENRANPDKEKLKTENETAKQFEDQNSDLNTQAVRQECNVPSRLTEHRVSPDREKLKTENETAEQVKDQNKNLNTQVVSQECNVPSGLTNTQKEIPQDVTRNLYPKLDLNLKQEKEIEVKQISQKRAKHQPLTLEQLHNLYYNPQLMENMQYIDRFIQNEIKKENHEFYEILSNYQRSRKSYVQAEEEIRALQQNYNQLQEQVWTTERSTITAKGTCGDGANCKTTHMYDTCVFSDSVFKNLKKALESIRHNIQNQLALHSYSAQLARLQVESYIHGLYLSSPVFRDIARNAPVQATEKHSRDVQHQILKLRECISVLFVFHRRPITDEEFENNIQAWTKKLVALLLRTASYEDHMFILNHVLRCPSGIGSWAANFVSVPMFMSSSEQSTFGCPLLDHVMTGLATVLMPIKARTDFICMMSQSITPDVQQKNNWILVDSDGEEDEDPKNAWMYLHENDLVAILQQFPMSEVFQHVLMLTQDVTGVLQYDIKRTRDSTFLKLIAFCTYLVNILSWGLQTYSMSRYKQLNKRIGRMIRQCVQYVSDHWENFEKHYKNLLPLDYILRIQVEYDQFFLRSTNSILTAQKLGSWQFMTDMPFSTVSKATMWQLLWLLHQKHKQGFNLESLPTEEVCRKFISDDDSKMQLADIMQQLSASEMIYLLTALSNMAQNRPAAELDFIQTVCLHLFEICYVINETREMCSKVGRELLVSLATAHPFVLSLLIQRTHENMEHIGVMALYLFKELPFHLWLPQESDFVVLREWLLNSELGEPKNQLAQMVLSNVNWDVDHERDRLFMPYDVHRQTAILLVEAYGKFVINKQLGYFFIEGMKQVALAVRQQQTNEQQFNNWSWEVASKLHLHQSTFPKADLGLARASGGPPDLSKDNSLLQITKGLKEKNVMACYAAIMISTVGHRFLSIIESLLAADDSMYKVAKIIWSHDFPGPVTEYFGCMTQKLLSDSSSKTDSNSTLSVIKFWIKVVTKINKWYQDKNCCYLIDVFVKSAFTCKVGLEAIKPEFQDTMQKSIIRLKLESAPGINSLNIYRWGLLAMNIPFDHPVLPIVWQRFFVLFLGRPTSSSSFFFVTEQSENTESNQLENLKFVPKKEFHLELSRLFQTMQLWIEEPTLHDAKLYLPALPPQYQSDKLLQLFQNQTMTSEWTTSLQGDKTKLIPPDRAVVISAKERILNRLKRHDSPLDPPPLQPDKALVPDVNVSLFEDKQAIMHLLNSDLNILKEYAKSFHVRISHHVAIDDDFCKLLPQLYYNKPSQIKEKTVDEIVQRQIDENRAEFKQKMIEGLNPPPQNVCVAAVHVENVITILVKLCRSCTDELRLSQYNDISCSLFFRLIEIMNVDVEFYPPSKQFFSSCIDLLGKFEIADWFKFKVPGTLELKRFADVLGAALYSCGADPDDKHSMVFELYIRHLSALLQHQFPSNLNNVINIVLQGTATQKIHVKAWEIIYSKCFPSSVTKDNRENDQFNVLSIEQIKEILNWMGTFFLQVRISSADYANFGLYPKLKSYVPHIIQLQVDMILCLVQKIIPNLSDFNPSQTLDMLWTTAIEVFAPWIITLKTESQLLSPWIQTDVDNSKLVVEKFRSILDTFHQNFRSIIPPYQKDILNMTWMYFTGNLCNKDTPKHVTKVYVDELIQLPWQQFKPDFHVLESMAKCHGESKHIEIPNIEQKMLQAEMYNWLPLTSDKFRHASNWFLQTCDPKCIQAERTSTLSLGLRLLKSASGFNVPSSGHWSAELSVKRQNYVHSIVQLICQCTYDTEVNMNTISTVLINLLTEIETVIGAVVDLRIQKEETLDLVKEVFSLLNNCNPDNRSVDVMTTTIYQWLQSSPSSILLLPSIQASSRCLASHKQIVQIVEECIQVYFKGGLDKSDGGGWDQVLAAIQIPDMNVEEFLDTALEEGSYLLLYGYIVLKLPLCQKLSNERDLIVQLLDWSDRARPTPETESRLILWWFKIMEMILRQIDFGLDQSSCINLLQRFVAILHQQGKERESGGILGAIGFGKHSPLTPQFRIIARALSAMISLQIDGDSVLRLNQEEELANTSQSRTDVGTLQSMKTSKQYQSFKSEIEIAVIFVTDRSNCLRHTQELLHNFSLAFYPDKEFLSVVHHQGN